MCQPYSGRDKVLNKSPLFKEGFFVVSEKTFLLKVALILLLKNKRVETPYRMFLTGSARLFYMTS